MGCSGKSHEPPGKDKYKISFFLRIEAFAGLSHGALRHAADKNIREFSCPGKERNCLVSCAKRVLGELSQERNPRGDTETAVSDWLIAMPDYCCCPTRKIKVNIPRAMQRAAHGAHRVRDGGYVALQGESRLLGSQELEARSAFGGCLYNNLRAPLLRVHIRASDFWNLPYLDPNSMEAQSLWALRTTFGPSCGAQWSSRSEPPL